MHITTTIGRIRAQLGTAPLGGGGTNYAWAKLSS